MNESDSVLVAKVKMWLGYAMDDLRWAEHGFSLAQGNPYRLIGYHGQQAAEKYLKAYLSCQRIDFPYTHDIGRLLDLCAPLIARQPAIQAAEELTPYAVSARYPDESDEVTQRDARRAVELAKFVQSAVLEALSEKGLHLTD